MTILDALADPNLLGAAFSDAESWRAWRVFLGATFGLPLSDAAIYAEHTGRTTMPTGPAREAWVIVGRRGGKSRIAALVAVFLAAFRDYTAVLAPGERGTLPIIAADRRQARTVMRYVTGLLEGAPMLKRLVTNQTAESVELATGVTIEVHTCSFRSVRGYTVVGAVLDEVAFYRSDDSANPDTELVAAIRPAMATVPGALLLAISSPYARRGVLWDAYRRHYGPDGDPAVLVWQAPTRAMNPLVPERVIAEAYEADAPVAAAEYGAEFRRDLEAFVSREVVEAVTIAGREELPPVDGIDYVGFLDAAGGSGSDSFTMAVAHGEEREGRQVAVLDLVGEAKPPFDPFTVAARFAETLRRYRVARVLADRYAGAWVVQAFAQHDVDVAQAAEPKGTIYANALPLLNGRRAELLDHARLHAQLCALERRARVGGDAVDHPSGSHDDVANAACGALVAAVAERTGAGMGLFRYVQREYERGVREGRYKPLV
jgi:hypothetical protein